MTIDPASKSPASLYAWMTGLITPRPIGWISTRSAAGVNNLAPYSYFNAVGTRPPLVMYAPANDVDGTEKDSLVNARETGQFVVNLTTEPFAESMVRTADGVGPDVDEFELAGLSPHASDVVTPPRVDGIAAALECVVHQILSFETGPGAAHCVFGRIVSIHVDDGVIDDRGHLDPALYPTIGRMAGRTYCRTGDRFPLG